MGRVGRGVFIAGVSGGARPVTLNDGTVLQNRHTLFILTGPDDDRESEFYECSYDVTSRATGAKSRVAEAVEKLAPGQPVTARVEISVSKGYLRVSLLDVEPAPALSAVKPAAG